MRTGYEKVIPMKTSSNFVGKARGDGKVLSVDDDLKLLTLQYKDKSVEAFQYGDVRGESPGMAVNHNIQRIPELKVNATVKAGDVVTYHADFFHRDPITKELSWCNGIQARVAIMAKDVTLEDSSMISTAFAEKLKFNSVYDRAITITSDMLIEEFVKVGDPVQFNTVLLKLQYADTADLIGEVDDIFDDLKQVEYRSKHEGVVSDIRIYHTTDELSEQLTKFITKMTTPLRKLHNATKATHNSDKFDFVSKVPIGTKIKGIALGETDILIVYYIKSSIGCGIGDKIILDSSLKTVIGKVETNPMTTEEGAEIDVIFSAASVFNRIILSPIISGVLESVVQAAEREVLDIYFG